MGKSTKSRWTKESIFSVFYFFKDNVKTAHWVGNSQLRSLDTDKFFKVISVVDDIQASVTINTMKQWSSRKNPDLLQKEEENVAEEANDIAAVNAEANKFDDNNNEMFVTTE